MKRGWAFALLIILLVIPAAAQVRGVPPSVTSLGPSRSFTPGVPASVTSLGPNGFGGPCSTPGALIPAAMGCTDPSFTRPFFGLPPFPDARVNRRPRRHHGGVVPIYVPYGYPVYPVVVQEQPETDAAVDEETEPPAPTVFERRSRTAPPPATPEDDSRYGAHYLDSREHPTPPVEPRMEVYDETPVLLIYKDGHQREVKNYAIVGSTLYDLGMFVAQRIPLADLNLDATIKANEDRGVEFTLPSSIRQQP